MKIRYPGANRFRYWHLLCVLLCVSSTLSQDVKVENKTEFTDLSNDKSSKDNFLEENGSVILDDVFSEPSEAVQSSFEELVDKGDDVEVEQPQFSHVEIASQNSGILNGATEDIQNIVVSSVDMATVELQKLAESSQKSEDPIVPSPPNNSTLELGDAKNVTEEVAGTIKHLLEVPKIETKDNLTEEIPSFSEWAQKQLEEAEKKRDDVNSSAANQNWNGRNISNKISSKNYASPDCGAKIVAANPEATSPSSVLSPSRDEYKLNRCTTRIWFIVELCEAIQAKRIDLANFELFSSSPKDFSISVSDRFPSREWSNVGNFAAKDERDIQTFDLHPHLFGKYIKLEMHSHHGSEHFCPISLFRVYGTSEFEVLEKEDQPQGEEEDDEETLDSEKDPSPNLFSSATDAVISIVKKAAEVLGNKGNYSNQTNTGDQQPAWNYTPLITSCTTPSHIVVCDNCSDVLFGNVYELLSCRSKQISKLLHNDIIKKTIYNTDICLKFGLDFHTKRTSDVPNIFTSYVKSFFPPRYLAALCNTVAIIENKVVLNISKQINTTLEPINKTKEDTLLGNTETPIPDKILHLQTLGQEQFNTEEIPKSDSIPIKDDMISNHSIISQIKPTKTLGPDEVIVETYIDSPTKSLEVKLTDLNEEAYNNNSKEVIPPETGSTGSTDEPIDFDTTESSENLDLDNLISDFENNVNVNSATPPPQVKESVFLRLSNRIKTLERNMSLSSQYLEELSRRYKRQVEEMQRLLEKTILTLTDESKKKDERNNKMEEKINQLTEMVENLILEKNAFSPVYWSFIIILSFLAFLIFCQRNEYKYSDRNNTVSEVQRRKSIDVVNHNTPSKKQRRPSEEILKISGTYEHLLVDEIDSRKKNRDKKRKKKKRSNSITTLSEENSDVSIIQRATWSESNFNSKPEDNKVWSRQESAPPQVLVTWNNISNGVEDIPIVLDESENSPLPSMPLPKPLREETAVKRIASPSFLRTASDLRKERNLSVNSPNGHLHQSPILGHKKSSSVDETKRQKSPVPSEGAISVNTGENKFTQKKEKKGAFKKIFKKVF